MKSKTHTRQALFSSVIALVLCCTTLLGSTFAWFTDSVESANNVIVAGNLDVDLQYSKDMVNWKDVKGSDELFEKNALWEPGRTEVVYLKVKNIGSLALKYKLGINVAAETQGKNVAGAMFNLSNYIHFGTVEGVEGAYASREAARAAVTSSQAIKAGYSKAAELYPANNTESKASEQVLAVVVFMPESVGNEANYREVQPKIELGVNLVATQLAAELDSFGPDYDENAQYPGDPWVGEEANPEDAPKDVDGIVTINTAAELAAFAADVNAGNSYAGKTVKLNNNINLANKAWTPIGACNSTAYFQGTFDGQGYTIYGLNVDKSTDTYMYSTAGLFGWVDTAGATIKNVNISGATVQGSHWVGGVVGYMTGRIENCSVTDSVIVGYNVNSEANGDKIGGIVGYMNEHGYINNNTVSDCTISGNRDIGGIAGSVTTTTYEMKNNKVTDTVITYITSKSYDSAGEIVSGRTGYVADDTNVADNVTIVKSLVVSTPEELADALKNTDKHIAITLANNIDVPISSLGEETGGSGEYKLAGEDTETLTIDLNKNKLNITTTYWSNIGAKNDDAVFTIKNGTMTSSQETGTWNSYDLCFSNCNYVIEDVTFEKAVALENAGKSATLKNVKINESHDYYALWITAEGQDVEIDGLTVNSAGRGIKIDEQYDSTPAKVTLDVANADFNTVKKAAIMVKSAAGADITLNNVDISDVAGDNKNAVWVDADAVAYADKVTVTGGYVINEPVVVANNTELVAAINSGSTDILLGSGTYIIPDSAQGKTLTFRGVGESTKIATQDDGSYEGCDYSLDGATVVFDNISITTNSSTYTGYARLNATYNNCTINGTYTLYGNSEFNNCTFNVSGDVYNIWTWGAPNATFNGCTFNSDGKALLLYGTEDTKLTVDGCIFNDNGGLTDLKAAIEIGNDYNKSYELIVNDTTVNGYEINDKGINTGTTLWANKNSMGTDKLNVVVDGVDVY